MFGDHSAKGFEREAMPGPAPFDYRLERYWHDPIGGARWAVVEFGDQRSVLMAYHALTQQLELDKVRFRVVRPNGETEVETAP